MSIQALSWVAKQKIQPSSLKFVLLALADCANAEMKCWPSIAYLEIFTSLERKTIIQAIGMLKGLGFLLDTTERVGRTKSIKIYRLNISLTSSSNNGTAKQCNPRTEAVHLTARKQSQKRHTEPLTRTIIGTKRVNLLEKNYELFQRKLIAAGIPPEQISLWFNGNELKLNRNGQQIIFCKSQFVADKIAEKFDTRLLEAFPKGFLLEIKPH